MNATGRLTDRIRAAVNAELDKRREETEMGAAETSEVRITVKVKNQKVWRVLYSRVTESDMN